MSEQELIEGEIKWSTAKFAIGWAKLLMNHCLWVWVTFTAVGFKVLRYGSQDGITNIIVISGWILVTAIYMLGSQGFNKMLSNSKIETKVGIGK